MKEEGVMAIRLQGAKAGFFALIVNVACCVASAEAQDGAPDVAEGSITILEPEELSFCFPRYVEF